MPAEAHMPGDPHVASSLAAVLNAASVAAPSPAFFDVHPATIAHVNPSPRSNGEALRKDLLAFHGRHENALSYLIFRLDDGQAVLAHHAIVEARLPALLSQAEPLGESEPAPLDGDINRSPRGSCRLGRVQQ